MNKHAFRIIIRMVMVSAAISLMGSLAHAGVGVVFMNSTSGSSMPINTYYANTKALTKFVNSLPLLNSGGANNITQPRPGGESRGQYLPVAVPEKWVNGNGITTSDDYYELGIVEYQEKMHSDLQKQTRLRGYVQIETSGLYAAGKSRHIALTYPNGNPILGRNGQQVYAVDDPHYLGPIIVATKGVPTRVKYTNYLPSGSAGDLFLPVDETLMGAGMAPFDAANNPCDPTMGGNSCVKYTQNRAEIHLHGGNTPWISDGTPFQWTVPLAEISPTPNLPAGIEKGPSFVNVPDMPDPGPGSGTLYYPNTDSGRLMFYHDHSVGTTRLNVYAGEAAGYLLVDNDERNLFASYGIGIDAGNEVPLVIQERTYVPDDIAIQDAKWDTTHWGQPGDLWFPHVYETNQLPWTADGTNPAGRWDYGPWFWPIFPVDLTKVPYLPDMGAYGNVTTTPEAFGDTPIINGTAYPTLTVDPKAYRLRILNAANDRAFNLSFFVAEPFTIGVAAGGQDYETPVVTINGCGPAAAAVASVDPFTWAITGVAVTNYGACTGAAGAPTPTSVTVADSTYVGSGASLVISAKTEVKMVPAVPPTAGSALPACSADAVLHPDPVTGLPKNFNVRTGAWTVACWPTTWPTDGRDGGVPDPQTAGPKFIQVGNEGGLLPQVSVVPPNPVNYEYFRRSVTVLNILDTGLLLMPAERADAVVDFSAFAGKTLILYNDSPAPMPAFDPRIDYYTGDPDQTDAGGWRTTMPGQGPNTRTLMQIVVNPTVQGAPTTFSESDLTAKLPGVFAASGQPKPVVAESAFNAAFGTSSVDRYANIFTGSATQHTFDFTAGDTLTYLKEDGSWSNLADRITVNAGEVAQIPVLNKAIQELFDPLGRMNATLGVELPFTNANTQTTIPLGYLDPLTETLNEGETQIWKITHNGVDSHPVHFHLLNVQVINRIGWDGTVKPPAANEVGWKETVRMNPLEDIVVAVRAKKPELPGFGVPDSVRSPDPTMPPTATLRLTNPATGNTANYSNVPVNFGNEYVWHCHILGHEENDFMRAFVYSPNETVPVAPSGLSATVAGQNIDLSWTDNSSNEIGFRIERATGGGGYSPIGSALANALSYTDTGLMPNTSYSYRVVAVGAAGDSPPSNEASVVATIGVTPPSADFGYVPVGGTPAPASVTISNTGQVGAQLTALNLAGTDSSMFSIQTGSCGPLPIILPAGGSCWFTATFTPTSTGTKTAAIQAVSNAPAAPPAVPLTGTGTNGSNSVRINLVPPVYYPSLATAFAAAMAGNTIQALWMQFNEPLVTLNTSGTVFFKGGYDNLYGTNTNMTTLKGVLTVVRGTLVIENLTIM